MSERERERESDKRCSTCVASVVRRDLNREEKAKGKTYVDKIEMKRENQARRWAQVSVVEKINSVGLANTADLSS